MAYQFEQLEPLCMLAGTPELVADLNLTPTAIPPSSTASLGDYALFSRFSSSTGGAIWRTDGTTAGTKLVKAGITNSSFGVPANLTAVGSRVYFTTQEPQLGQLTLWTSDGTEQGTRPIQLLNTNDSSGFRMKGVGEVAYFTARNFDGLNELWKSDGTSAGTTFLSTSFDLPTDVNGTLYFAGSSEANGRELWKGDGSAAGSQMVKDINATESSSPSDLINVNGTLYFLANDGVTGSEIWKSDGTESGTVLVNDFQPNQYGQAPFPFGLTQAGGRLFFRTIDSLWTTDGTSEGTIPLGPMTFGLGFLTDVNGTLFYQGYTSSKGLELWKSDGTVEGTTIVKDINPNSYSGSYPSSLANVDGTLFFGTFEDLWKSDGTEAGTILISPGNAPSDTIVSVNGHLLYGAFGRFMTSDGTTEGTVLLGDGSTDGSSPAGFVKFQGALYFTTQDGTQRSLWKTDGTSAGTKRLKSGFEFIASPFIPQGNYLLFRANDAEHGAELWRTDGTESGTVIVRELAEGSKSTFPDFLTSFNGKTYFVAQDGLWSTDGTESGTQPATPYYTLALSPEVNGSLYFMNGGRLMRTDGSQNGTAFVHDIPNANDFSQMTAVGEKLFFTAGRDLERTLWTSDGTAQGTIPLMSAPTDSLKNFYQLTAVDGRLYFLFGDIASGAELWSSDGTVAGTQLIRSTGSYNAFFYGSTANLNEVLYFVAGNDTDGLHLWKSDGTAAGTGPVVEPISGHFLKDPTNLRVMDGILYFSANDGVSGPETWSIHGINSKITKLADVGVGAAGSSPGPFEVMANKLYFAANDGTSGSELWSLPLDANRDDLNLDGTINVQDMNLFCAAVQSGHASKAQLDAFWSRNDTGPGDANMDHTFNTSDLMAVFQSAKYRTGKTATWEEGDWNCDGIFNQHDLIFALQRGWYTPD